jgi:hypothetical protein
MHGGGGGVNTLSVPPIPLIYIPAYDLVKDVDGLCLVGSLWCLHGHQMGVCREGEVCTQRQHRVVRVVQSLSGHPIFNNISIGSFETDHLGLGNIRYV